MSVVYIKSHIYFHKLRYQNAQFSSKLARFKAYWNLTVVFANLFWNTLHLQVFHFRCLKTTLAKVEQIVHVSNIGLAVK